ncbi:MAG: flavodoxin [Campylobacterota bacterium]|nr:flavodoxin [Campylobacterota bacterium]
MPKIGLFYASSTGNTEDVAQEIKEKFEGADITLHNLGNATNDAMEQYDKLIFGISTWGEGDLQDDWEEFLPNLEELDCSDKTIAMFGLGDQEEYCDHYLDAMGTIYDVVIAKGTTVVGSWSVDGYDFDESTAVRNEEFVGLALDADNQDDLTSQRITDWIEQIKPYF